MLGLYTLINNKQIERLIEFIYFIDEGFVKSAYNANTKSPIQQFEYKNWNILIEGAVYNLNQGEIKEYLLGILESNEKKIKIESFQDIADGEFIIQMINIQQQIGLIISDKYARLPFYYTSYANSIALSRNINNILIDIPEIRFNYQAFHEFLSFEYMLGNKTYIENIFRLEPFEYLEICFKKTYKVSTVKRASESYDKKKKKKPHLGNYYHLFNNAVENRVEFCKKMNFKISSGLSGGFDSRAIFGALNQQNVKADHFTFEYIQDESAIAKSLFNITGKIGQYEKLSFANIFNFADSLPIVYDCQGLANPLTCFICKQDNEFLANKQESKSAGWGGFGGEFIRHPYKYAKKDIYTSLFEGYLPGNLFINDDLINTYSSEKFRGKVKEHFQNYNEKSLDGQIKHFYLEYYIHRVGNGEDLWGRNNFWTIHPMMAMPLIDFFKDMPLKFASFSTFKKLLKKIDPKLITIPIYKDKYNLKSFFYFKRDIDNYISFKRIQIKAVLRSRFYFLIPVYQKYFKKTNQNKISQNNSELLNEINKLFEQSKINNLIFNKSMINEGVKNDKISYSSNMLSLLIYIKSIEDLYSYKIKIED